MSAWADRYRILHKSYAAEAGPYRTGRTPYLREVMDVFADPGIRMIVFTKCARIGGTEAANNMLAYAIDEDPGPVLYVYPTQDDAEEECRDRLVPLIEGSPRLRAHCPSPAWATKNELRLDTLNVYMAWAKSPRTLIRRTIRYFWIDELDNCDAQAGALGDTLTLTRKRTLTFRDRAKGVITSTPTTEDGAVYRTFQESDKRRYHVPCPKCGTYQVLTLDQVRAPEGQKDPDLIEIDDLARYECVKCKALLDDKLHKRWMIDRGVWVPESQRIAKKLPLEMAYRAVHDAIDRWSPELKGKKPKTRIAGFHINAIYSPFVRWSEFLAEYFRSVAELKRGNPEPMRVFVNSMLGEPWRDAVEEVKPGVVQEKRKAASYDRDVVPDGAVRIVAGADVQLDHIYYVIRAWGYYRESWLIREGICGDFQELMDVVRQEFPCAGDSSRRMRADYLAIDSGARTFEVYEFANATPGVLPVKGQQTGDYRTKPSRIKYTPQGRLDTRHVQLWHVNTSIYKEMLYRAIRVEGDGNGAWHINRQTSDDYCLQVTSERQVWKTVSVGSAKRRRLVWEPKTTHAANHYLDAEVYAMAIADMKGMLSMAPQPVRNSSPQTPSQETGSNRQGARRRLLNHLKQRRTRKRGGGW